MKTWLVFSLHAFKKKNFTAPFTNHFAKIFKFRIETVLFDDLTPLALEKEKDELSQGLWDYFLWDNKSKLFTRVVRPFCVIVLFEKHGFTVVLTTWQVARLNYGRKINTTNEWIVELSTRTCYNRTMLTAQAVTRNKEQKERELPPWKDSVSVFTAPRGQI
jgi:hypothetical protein